MSDEKSLFFYEGDDFNTDSFFMIPKALFTSAAFSALSNEAKLLYSLMLERMKLSLKNGWFDSESRAYIYFTIEEIKRLLHIGKDKSVKLLSELDDENGCGLIRKKRTQGGQPTIIYVKRIAEEKHTCKDENISDITPSSQVGKSDLTVSENQNCTGRKNRIVQVGKTDSNNNKYNNTDISNTYSILSYQNNINKAEKSVNDKIRDREDYKKIICENVDYDILVKNHGKSNIDPIINIIQDAVCSSRKNLIICRDEIPQTVVKSRLLKLSMFHIEYVLECLKATTTRIHNIKSYILTSLYNSYDTIEHYYTNSVNQSYGSP